jgi:hypothetical protein
MISFHVQYNREKTLKEADAAGISIIGRAFLIDESPDDYFISERREEIYRFSLKRFFYLLANGMIDDSDFVLSGIRSNDFFPADSLFAVAPGATDPSLKEISLNTGKNTTGDKESSNFKSSNLQIPESATDDKEKAAFEVRNIAMEDLKNKNYRISDLSRSDITLYTDSFHIDTYGNTNLIEEMFIKGFMGKRRVGDLLPGDYIPSPDFEKRVREENVIPEIKSHLLNKNNPNFKQQS